MERGADRHQIEGHEFRGSERQRIQGRLGLFHRFDVHEKSYSGSVLAEPELLDLADEIELQRRSEAVLGKSPLAYFQDLRIERARSLLHGGDLNVDTIAAEVGYMDGVTLRTLLRERLGRGVRDLRAR